MNRLLNGPKNVNATSFLVLLHGDAWLMVLQDLGVETLISPLYFSWLIFYRKIQDGRHLHINNQNFDVIRNIKYIKAY